MRTVAALFGDSGLFRSRTHPIVIASYHCWIQAGNVGLEGTCTPLIKRPHRRTSRHIPCAAANHRQQRITHKHIPQTGYLISFLRQVKFRYDRQVVRGESIVPLIIEDLDL